VRWTSKCYKSQQKSESAAASSVTWVAIVKREDCNRNVMQSFVIRHNYRGGHSETKRPECRCRKIKRKERWHSWYTRSNRLITSYTLRNHFHGTRLSQIFPRLLWNLNGLLLWSQKPTVRPYVEPVESAHILTLYFSKIYFNIIFRKCFLPWVFLSKYWCPCRFWSVMSLLNLSESLLILFLLVSVKLAFQFWNVFMFPFRKYYYFSSVMYS
jgi:hypothetical protein